MCDLPCKKIKENWMPRSISVDDYWRSNGTLLFNIETENRKLSVMEKSKSYFSDKSRCMKCGGKISGVFGFVSVDDTFLWIYTQRSGYCKECAKSKAESDTELHKKNNAVIYERSKCYVTVKGSRRHYEGGAVVEDIGQNILLNPNYKTCV